MGASPDEEVATEREDQVRVSIARPFAVGRFAVMRGEFAAFVAATGHKADGRCHDLARWDQKGQADRDWRSPGLPQDDRHPVVCVGWNDAIAYVAWISSSTGKAIPAAVGSRARVRCPSRDNHAVLVGHDDFNGPSQLQWQRHVCRRRQGRVAQEDCSRRQFHRQSVGPLQRAWQRLGMDGGLLERKECRQSR